MRNLTVSSEGYSIGYVSIISMVTVKYIKVHRNVVIQEMKIPQNLFLYIYELVEYLISFA